MFSGELVGQWPDQGQTAAEDMNALAREVGEGGKSSDQARYAGTPPSLH